MYDLPLCPRLQTPLGDVLVYKKNTKPSSALVSSPHPAQIPQGPQLSLQASYCKGNNYTIQPTVCPYKLLSFHLQSIPPAAALTFDHSGRSLTILINKETSLILPAFTQCVCP
ncbi:hypothetical protein AMECASPLE_028475 [Ameca splendens]|uniref:Uncharacterized protein n=1 Tax=Ameca splendens TaxID=208324 RepID=A0ABV0ZSI9_9TELE